MAEVLLQARLNAAGVDVRVTSAGHLPGGAPASPGSVRAMAARGLGLDHHVSRRITLGMLEQSDLVVTMCRLHLRNAVAMRPDTFSRSFTLKELVRRGEQIGARPPGHSLDDWLTRLHEGRTPSALMRDEPIDDVEDPMGGSDAMYEATAVELSDLVDRFVELAFAPQCSPGPTQRETA